MKKHLVITLVTAAALLTSCGVTDKKPEGSYVDIQGVHNLAPDYRSNPDTALNKIVTGQVDFNDCITLQDNRFTIIDGVDSVNTVTWNGTFSNEDSTLKFNYADVNISGTKDKQHYTEQISKLNERGFYPATIAPQIYLADYTQFAPHRHPVFLFRTRDSWSILETHGDFLCVPSYGFTLDGAYKTGKDFAVNYVPEDSLRNDPYSEIYDQLESHTLSAQPNAERLEQKLRSLCNRYGVDSPDALQFHLTFSGGSWQMHDTNNTLITKGTYIESQNYPGFISMYQEFDDPELQQNSDDFYPLFLYIENDIVYYPGFIRK